MFKASDKVVILLTVLICSKDHARAVYLYHTRRRVFCLWVFAWKVIPDAILLIMASTKVIESGIPRLSLNITESFFAKSFAPVRKDFLCISQNRVWNQDAVLVFDSL